MTEAEKNLKIEGIRNDQYADAEFKARRIAAVESAYNSAQSVAAESAKQRQEGAEAELKANLREAYLKSPSATEADFEKDYPELRSEYLRSSALKDTEIAMTSQARATHANF